MTYLLASALREPLALTDSRDELLGFIDAAHERYEDAARCGHPAAAAWVYDRLPITVSLVDAEEIEAILADGTPELQREP